MKGIKIIVFSFILCGFQLCTVHCQSCKIERDVTGNIVVEERVYSKQECWIIPVPLGNFIHLRIKHMQSERSCDWDYVTINIAGTNDGKRFCSKDNYTSPIQGHDNVTVTHSASKTFFALYTAFELEYTIKSIECLNNNSFKCDNNSCVHEDKVCDGVKDCKNGADEIGCENIECLNNNVFKCDIYSCVHEDKVCDGVKDCKNGADEIGCENIECLKNNMFKCDNYSCVHEDKVCDGVKDCKNGADEIGCENIECLNNNMFQCDNFSCVHEDKVCDGVKDCKNGADEIGCETGDLSIKGVPEAIENAVFWLKQKRTAAWGWRENTPRAVVALYLASAATFNGTVLEEELMAKQTELKTAVALLKPSLTNSELSMFVNALLVTCHSPRQFYGNNLVKRLKEQVEESGNFTHPVAYLALCNANESWPLRAISDLNSILSSNSEYPFVKDLQAMAVTALSCKADRSKSLDDVFKRTTRILYKNTIKHFKKLQSQDGSFGNVYTTALITQALISSGQVHNEDWKMNATMKYLMEKLNSSTVDFLMIYLALPILNGKSLMDISRVNCSANPREHGDDPISEISDYLGPKMRVQYSLFIGDEKDVVHTISLRVPENYTASEVMELTVVEDPKYKFERETDSGKMYVYEIAGITNDPEAGKFWLLFVGAANTSEPLTHLTNGPDEVIMSDGEHLVFWYKTAVI